MVLDKVQGGLLARWLEAALTPWHAIALAEKALQEAGFERLRWQGMEEAEAGYVTLGGSALLAFRRGGGRGLRLLAAHSDSPCFRLKPVATAETEGGSRLLVAPYGGMILSSWMDRPLALAGRVFVRGKDGPTPRLLASAGPVATIPNACIHFNRSLNEGYTWGLEKDLRPLWPWPEAGFVPYLAELAVEAILSWDLALVSAEPAREIGPDGAWLQAPRLDNLGMVEAGLRAFLAAPAAEESQVLLICDHEEVGSLSRLGAESGYWRTLLERLLGLDALWAAPEHSLLLSADQAHAAHPNYPELGDPANAPVLNGGPVVKTAVNQSYATDARGLAMLRLLAEEAGVPLQTFAGRADIRGGATLGPILTRQLPLPAADIGNPLWAMHSIAETAGSADQAMMVRLMERFFCPVAPR